LRDEFKDFPESALYMIGTIDNAKGKSKPGKSPAKAVPETKTDAKGKPKPKPGAKPQPETEDATDINNT